MIARVVLITILCLGALAPGVARAAGDDATADARSHYEMGLQLFDARSHEQALIEFQRANELKSRPAALFMMAQCEYLLGRLKEARVHYEQYVSEVPKGEFVELAKDRIESIDKRPSTFVINTVPDDVSIHIAPEGAPGPVVTGQAPNNFQVPRGRYRIDVTKASYQGQTRIVEVDIAETKPLFFKLEPIPARLEIETGPPGATLYVNGNRARNPYRQDVPPGHYEIFAEATDFNPRSTEVTLLPGERRLLTGPNRFMLPYVQRSGRPELLVASGILGGIVGAAAVAAAIGQDLDNPDVASVGLTTLGGIVGVVGGVLVATPFVPKYIPDNRALFIMGSMWLGAGEGAALGLLWKQISTVHQTPAPKAENPCPPDGRGVCRAGTGDQLRAAFVASLPGIAVGLTAGALIADKAPTYGRVSLIQSAALGGLVTGALVQVATQWNPYGNAWRYSLQENLTVTTGNDRYCLPDGSKCAVNESSLLDLVPGAAIGLNVGLAAGLLGAYLPDQSKYGPTWKRVLLIDLAAGAGAVAGGVAGCVANAQNCLRQPTSDSSARARSAGAALAGGAIGLLGGILLTRHFDDDTQTLTPTAPPVSVSGTIVPVRGADGATAPGVGAFGTF